MTDLEKLKSILDNQTERRIQSRRFEDVTDFCMVNRDTELIVRSLGLSFHFTEKGRFQGIHKWK